MHATTSPVIPSGRERFEESFSAVEGPFVSGINQNSYGHKGDAPRLAAFARRGILSSRRGAPPLSRSVRQGGDFDFPPAPVVNPYLSTPPEATRSTFPCK